jgi:3-dehydroquinate dehydratase / shikimate dehydrogenase
MLQRTGGGPLVCLCLTGRSVEEDLASVREHGGSVDLLELRADCLDDGELSSAARLPGLAGLPVILTLRRERDGGRFSRPEGERSALLQRLLPAGFAYVDLEEDFHGAAVEQAAAAAGCGVIRSLHDFSGVPAGLARRLAGMPRSPRELPKAAVMPRDSAGLIRLLEAFEETRGRPKILIGMGEHGLCTRVLAGPLGSRLCYCSPRGAAAAPGHLDPLTLTSLYRFRSLTSRTEILGVAGRPISHSLSPLIHNRGLQAVGRDAVYIPFLAEELDSFLPAAERLGVRGLSVTVPHKEAAARLAARPDEAVTATGACNTLFRQPDRDGWAGANTDCEGFMAPLREALGGAVPAGLRATVIGAGGAARAVVHALSRAGAHVLVLGRSPHRAARLAGAYSAQWGVLDAEGAALMVSYGELVVQATSAGMQGAPEPDPFPECRFTGGEIVYEIVYNPAVTPFLDRARAAGCRTIKGSRMLLAQAREQFRLFTGVAYPEELAREMAALLEPESSPG